MEHTPTATRGRWRVPAAFGAVVLLVAVPVVVAFIHLASQSGYPSGDNAIIEMSALDVPRHLPLIGLYSRFGFHHPGPLLFYVAALPVRVFGPNGLMVAAGVVNLAAVVGLLVVLYRRGGELLVVLGAVMAFVLIRALGIDVANIWTPLVPILPLALAVALTWGVWSRDWWMLPWLAAVVTFVVQCHLGFAPVGAVLVGSSLVWAVVQAVRPRWGPGCPRIVLAVAAGVLVVLWLPPLIQQFTHTPGNLSDIFDFAKSGHGDVGAGTGLGILSQMVGPASPLFRRTGSGALIPLKGGSLWGLVAVLVPFCAAIGLAIWRRAYDALRLQGVTALLLPVSWISMAKITGPPFLYLTYWLMVVAAYLVLSTVWSVVCSLRPASAAMSIVPSAGHATRRLVAAVAISVVVLLGFGAAAVATSNDSQVGGTYSGGLVVQQFAGPAARAIAGRGLVLITATPPNKSNGPWLLETSAIESGLQAELQRRGVDVTTTNARAIYMGPDGVVGSRPIAGRLVVTADTSTRPVDVPGTTTIATSDSLSPAERREFQSLDRKHLLGQLTPAERVRWQELEAQAVVYRLTYRPVTAS